MNTLRQQVLLVALVLFGAAAVAQAQSLGMPGGMMGMRHDSSMMAGMADVHFLIANHDKITRTVTNLPDGIRTLTESTDPAVAAKIKAHVVGAAARVAANDSVVTPMMSPALRTLLRNGDRIHTIIDTTANGIALVQTSRDSTIVAALQQHATEVSALVRDGMAAMRRSMMNGQGGMRMSRP